ncbi:MAG: type II toxin-antitoxin system VapC family toxin [Armatimonadetes bacterium]|nr:type II toxin-antitoxin system VapC family toxin [Armatimonadota bacterium]
MSSSLSVGAVVIDASFAIAISARETDRETKATQEALRYSSLDYVFYTPCVLIAETLYVLCGKLQTGLLTQTEYAQAITRFEALMANILPSPNGDAPLVRRAEAIRDSYGCSRSADGIYIALAEALTASVPTVLLTFDTGMSSQAARNAPTVTVQTL